jgi:RNA polymerase sigma factor (sigma-70 family)
MNQKNIDNYELWRQFKEGNPKASNLIYQIYHKNLLNYGNKITQDSELVKDAVQDLFLNLLIRKGTLSNVDNIEPYLKSALRHDLARKIIATQKLSTFNDCSHNVFLNEHHNCIESHESEEKENYFVKLDNAVQKLPKRANHAVTMRFLQGMNNREIAEQMGINYQSVTNYIYRGMEILRNVMSKTYM